MKAILQRTDGRVRYYRLTEPVIVGKSDLAGVRNIVDDILKWDWPRLKEEARAVIGPQISDPAGISLVAISDATTHFERLIFPAYYVPEEGKYGFFAGDIGGRHTMMSEGGSLRYCYPDEVLLRWLARLNGLTFEGIDDPTAQVGNPIPEGIKRELGLGR